MKRIRAVLHPERLAWWGLWIAPALLLALHFLSVQGSPIGLPARGWIVARDSVSLISDATEANPRPEATPASSPSPVPVDTPAATSDVPSYVPATAVWWSGDDGARQPRDTPTPAPPVYAPPAAPPPQPAPTPASTPADRSHGKGPGKPQPTPRNQ